MVSATVFFGAVVSTALSTRAAAGFGGSGGSGAATAGTVVRAGFEGAAGNYIVLHDRDSGQDSVYMHLAHTPRLREGESVAIGQRIGSVGQTGDADGCHLHFELWTAPGWFKGHAYDPLPKLRRWDAAGG